MSFNNLHDFHGIQLADLSQLKILNASNNDLTKIEHIDTLYELKELDLSKNKLRQFEPNTFNSSLQIACL